MGLGAVLTTPQLLGPPRRFEKILGLPNGVDLAAVVPIGYPKGKFGPVRRMPPRVFKDRYGQTRAT
jgi:nitroreductase